MSNRLANAARKQSNGGDGSGDERVVYYDLDAGSRRHVLLLHSPALQTNPQRQKHRAGGNLARATAAGAANSILERPKEIFHQQPLFDLDGSGGEDDEDDENPFASLLQAIPRKPMSVDAVNDEVEEKRYKASVTSEEPSGPKKSVKSVLRKSTMSVRHSPPPKHQQYASPQSARGSQDSNGTMTSGATDSEARKPAKPVAISSSRKSTTRLSFEAADARPSRWSQKSTVSVKKKATSRRKSVANPLQAQTRLQSTPRRSSLPNSLLQSQGDEDSHVPKKRRLSDVLLHATLLSQQQKPSSDYDPPAHTSILNESSAVVENDDAIADTEHQMREERFETQFFSPSKPNAASRKKHKSDPAAVVKKIRGDLGAAVTKAIRRSNRDLTMLHSHGQTLLQSKDTAVQHAGLDNVSERPYVVIRLRRLCPYSSQIIYEASMHTISSEVIVPWHEQERARVNVVFTSPTSSYLGTKPNMLVKIYQPFHFIPVVRPGGCSTSVKAKWLLIGTNLSEAL